MGAVRPISALAAVLLLVGAAGSAGAQQQGWMGPGMMGPGQQGWGTMGQGWMGPGMQGMGPGMQGGMMMGPGMMGAWVENQLAALRTELRLTEAQTPAFDAYAKAVRDSITTAMGCCAGGGMMMGWQGNAPQMMQQMQQHMQARLDAMKAVQAAAAKLYEQLQPEQRSVFDRYAMMGMM